MSESHPLYGDSTASVQTPVSLSGDAIVDETIQMLLARSLLHL